MVKLSDSLQGFAHAGFEFRTQTPAQQRAEIVLPRVIHQIRGFDHVSRHAVNIAESVHQPDFLRIRTRVHPTAEHVGILSEFEAAAASGFDGFDELAVYAGQHFFPDFRLFGRFGRKRIAHAFVAARILTLRFTPIFSIRPVASKLLPITPMLPTMLDGSA